MSPKFNKTLTIVTMLGMIAALPVGMIAGADGQVSSGYVYEASTAAYGVATHDATEGAGEIGGRGASGMYQWHNQVAPAFNGQPGQDVEAGYASCGSSCGKRAILGAATATEGNVACTDTARWTPNNDCSSEDEAETRWPLWGASEAPFTLAEQTAAKDVRNAEMLTFPMSIAVISVVYNVNGCANGQLKLTGALISRMYRGNEPDGIKFWNHADLVALNPCLAAEATAIVPVIRSDGSGTTFAFSDFLVKSSGVSCWGPAELIGSCAQNEITGAQNPGVSAAVGANYGAFGYVEKQQADVDSRKQAQIQAKDGAFLLASEQGGTDAATATAPTLPASHGDWSQVSIAYASGATSYPISTFGYLMAIANPYDANGPHGDYSTLWTAAEYNALKEFLTWANEHTNVIQDVDVVNYAPVGAVVGAINREGIARMNYGPRFSYELGNDGTDAALVGYPQVGQNVNAQANGIFGFNSIADGDFRASSAGSLVGVNEGEGSYVCVSGTAVVLSGNVVSVDGVPVGVLAQGTNTPAGLVLGTQACGQVNNGVLLAHFVQ